MDFLFWKCCCTLTQVAFYKKASTYFRLLWPLGPLYPIGSQIISHLTAIRQGEYFLVKSFYPPGTEVFLKNIHPCKMYLRARVFSVKYYSENRIYSLISRLFFGPVNKIDRPFCEKKISHKKSPNKFNSNKFLCVLSNPLQNKMQKSRFRKKNFMADLKELD